MIKTETVANAPKVFSVKSNATRAAKAFITKNGENGLAFQIAAVDGGFEVQVVARGGHRSADLQAAGFRMTPWKVASTDALSAPAVEDPAPAEANDAAADVMTVAAREIDDVAATEAAIDARFGVVDATAAQVVTERVAETAQADSGFAASFDEAMAAGKARYGMKGKEPLFVAERRKRGWYWGPIEATAPKAAKASAPAGAAKAALGKRAAVVEAAERGELPAPPDFSAELHKRNRGRLAELVAMAEAGDIAGLKAYPIKPNCTSPKAMDRYRNFAVKALEARAAQA